MKRARVGMIATAVLAVATMAFAQQAGLLGHLDAGRSGGSGRHGWRRGTWRRVGGGGGRGMAAAR